MSNPTLQELLAWMKDKSQTQGWSALVAYDRRKANQMLEQLFIERFNSDSYLPPLSDQMTYGEHSDTTDHLFDLTFSVPQLAFANADLEDSRVELSLDFVGGMIITEYAPTGVAPRISKVQRVLPLNRPQLTMDLALGQDQGNIDNQGAVTLNIADGDNFLATFALGALNQIEIGRRFKLYFEDKLSKDQKIYPLGKLTGENGVLTPEAFAIRTMAAPGANRRDAENYQDGAVLMFVKLRDGLSGSYPTLGSDFKYPIPRDEGGKQYSGTLWLSSYTLFEKVMRPHVQADLPEVTFKAWDDGRDVAWPLLGVGGQISYALRHDYKVPVKEHDAVFWTEPVLPFGETNHPFTVMAVGTGIDVRWWGQLSSPFSRLIEWDTGDEWTRGDLHHDHDVHIRFDIKLDEQTGVVSFTRSPDSFFNLNVKGHDWLPDLGGGEYSAINDKIEGYFRPKVEAWLQQLTTPEVDTFLVRNLLFPGHNALRLSDAHVPGDLALFGHIDPLRTHFQITPLWPTIEAGQTQQFKMEPPIDDVTWSIRATDSDDVDVGSISGTGLFTAAPASALVQGYQRVVVSATGKLNGETVTSSAMISVVETTISVSPLFQVYNTPVVMTAETLSGKLPTWSLKNPEHGAKLSVKEGRECTYTGAPMDPTKEPSYLDTVLVTNPETGSVTESQMLMFNIEPSMKVVVHKDSEPASGELQLQVVSRDQGAMNPDQAKAICKMLTPDLGSVSPSGVFREAEGAHGIAVVEITRQSFETVVGFIVLPLPLATYGQLIMDINASLLAKAGGLIDDDMSTP